MYGRSLALAFLFALGCTPPAVAPAPAPAPVPAPVPVVDPPALDVDELRRDLGIFAADSFRGRESGTRDADRAARFLADRLATIGLEPAGDSGFYQRVPMQRVLFGPDTKLTVTVRGERTPRTLTIGRDLLPLLDLDPDQPPPRTTADAELVFAGYGLNMPDLRRDDSPRFEEVGGKVVVIVNGAPANASPERRKVLESQEQLGTRLELVLARRPAAVILLLTGEGAELYDQLLPRVMRSVSLATAAPVVPEAMRPFPMILIGRVEPGSPFLPPGWPANDRRQALTGRRFTAKLDVRTDRFTGYNVMGIARGSDPALDRSYVAYGAHYDHIGILAPVNGDSIANGADDDGSGSVSLLGIARAFKARPTRRSALFVWHVAEEKGLLGSEYFTSRPTVPIDSIVAQLNADMIGRNAPDSLYLVGPAAAPDGQSRILGRIVDSVNVRLAAPFRFNREWDSATHPLGIYERSDHYNYAQKGIPIVFLTSGLHDDYHKVSDEVAKIDFAKMARVGELLFRAGQAVGNRGTRPR
jgi:hypothetical protein